MIAGQRTEAVASRRFRLNRVAAGCAFTVAGFLGELSWAGGPAFPTTPPGRRLARRFRESVLAFLAGERYRHSRTERQDALAETLRGDLAVALVNLKPNKAMTL